LSALNKSSPYDPIDYGFHQSNQMVSNLIKGELLAVSYQYDSFDPHMDDDGLKKILAHLIAEDLLTSKYIEFTKQEDIVSGKVTARARMYVTPNSDVQIIRTIASKT
jgi:hypothetical protein